MLTAPHTHRHSHARLALALAALLGCLCLPPAATYASPAPPPKGGKKIERYPPSFRSRVKKAIERGVDHLRTLQAPDGTWGSPADAQAMGHTALPLLTMLKAGVSREDEHVQRAFAALGKMKLSKVYSVGLLLMAIQAGYQPKLDTLDTDVGTERHKRLRPKEIRKRLSKADLKTMQAGVAYLLEAQNASGLWHYDLPAQAKATGRDLSNSQYALLGLRAAMDSGIAVPAAAWRDALKGLLTHQDPNGPRTTLLESQVRDGYVFRSKVPAEIRGFHYSARRKHGPKGENTLWVHPATGSMTTAGVACVSICTEGLWRSRRFKGAARRKAADAIRDGTAWIHAHFSVTANPEHPNKRHHFYYLYGLERMGMLIGRRWIGQYDWYKLGADLLLEQEGAAGGWGRAVQTSFAILFLKRATRATDAVVTTGD